MKKIMYGDDNFKIEIKVYVDGMIMIKSYNKFSYKSNYQHIPKKLAESLRKLLNSQKSRGAKK